MKNIIRYPICDLASFIMNSNKIENINYSYQDTENVIKEWHRLIDPVERQMFEQTTPCYIIQHYKALHWALQTCSVMTWDQILKMHQILMKGQLGPHEAGLPRRVQVYIGEHIPPAPGEELMAAIQKFIRWMEQNLILSKSKIRRLRVQTNLNRGLYIQVYEAHCRFESLHPFLDGNGRSGRIFWLSLLHYYGFEFNEIDIMDRWDYYRSLNQFHQWEKIKDVTWFPPRLYAGENS